MVWCWLCSLHAMFQAWHISFSQTPNDACVNHALCTLCDSIGASGATIGEVTNSCFSLNFACGSLFKHIVCVQISFWILRCSLQVASDFLFFHGELKSLVLSYSPPAKTWLAVHFLAHSCSTSLCNAGHLVRVIKDLCSDWQENQRSIRAQIPPIQKYTSESQPFQVEPLHFSFSPHLLPTNRCLICSFHSQQQRQSRSLGKYCNVAFPSQACPVGNNCGKHCPVPDATRRHQCCQSSFPHKGLR